MFKCTYWDKVFKYLGIVVWIISIATLNINLLLLSITFFVMSIIVGGYNCVIDEHNYIWRMNEGPSSINRTKLLKHKETSKSEFVVWTGGENGYYKASNGRKFDYYLQEIK